ncbi:MAG TPA: alanine--tRNA ligase [Nitrospiria bacterium]|nr:alanine--tRNA ligase [Nitrospiria bacterium]
MKSDDLRKGFLEYFGGRGHTLVPSSPLIPQKDPTLLFTNAGMVQFKEVFLGKESRGYKRAVSVQKCMRAGGKHNDLDNVGMTGRHHTFFEMLGNFSFGDYFKSDAIAFAWELLTKHWNLPKDRLWITVFREDDEAEGLWKQIGVPADRIKRMDEKDNFWAMGDTGPCGPCSEILIDQGEAAAGAPHDCKGVGCDCDRYLEIWNLVFMQFIRDTEGRLTPLPKPSIDTGMGLERITAVTQGVLSNYDTDLFLPIFKGISEMTDQDLAAVRNGMPGRVVADHIRAIAFLISDGVLPSNEGRGYLLRRVIRRAARYGKELGLNEPFLYKLSGTVVDTMVSTYPELARTRTVVAQVTQGEEERFIQTLNQGMGLFKEVMAKVKAAGQPVISGGEAFRLYDTYGFPLDIAMDMARDVGLRIDEAGYQAAMADQRDRARKSWVVKEVAPYYNEASSRLGLTDFVGYDGLEEEVRLIGILKGGRPVGKAAAGETVELVFNRTPFYGESGGQAGDQGLLEHPSALAEIHTTIKPVPGFFVHQGKVTQGEIVEGETYRAVVNPSARWGAARNHTATHILHSTLREVLGEHVKQSGSLVTSERLRFDFGHFKPLTAQEIKRIETVVNERVREDDPVETQVMDFQEAVRAGALAFFDDKYGDRVRVVRISDFSKELCGGTHCHETGQVGMFKLVQEGSIAAGVRRIEALTGEMAYLYVRKQEDDIREVAAMLKVQPAEVVERTRRLLAQMREREKEMDRLKGRAAGSQAEDVASETRTVGGIKVLAKRLQDGLEPKDLRAFVDTLKNRLKTNYIAVVASTSSDQGNAFLIAAVSADLTGRFNAGEIAKEIAGIVGGSGGGRPDMAQAGGKNVSKLPEALARVYEIVEKTRP